MPVLRHRWVMESTLLNKSLHRTRRGIHDQIRLCRYRRTQVRIITDFNVSQQWWYKMCTFYLMDFLFTDFEGLVTQSLLMANFEAAVEVCLHHKKMAEAITLAIAGGPELLLRTQKRFFQSSKSDLNRVKKSSVPWSALQFFLHYFKIWLALMTIYCTTLFKM